MEENINQINLKKERIKLAVFVVSILLIVSSVSYAFFAAGINAPASTDVNIGSEVSESLSFTPGTPINLTANLTNFAEGDGSLSGETITSANIKASSSVGSASQNYYVYYNVTSNNFVYTVDNNTPELILTITDPEGNVLQNLTNHPKLEYKTVTGNVSGFDVTEYEGLILIDDNYTISTTDSVSGTTQEWKAKLTFINLDTIQTLNEGKVFESDFILRSSQFNMADQLLSVHDETNGLINHDSELTEGAKDNNYRYSGNSNIVSNNWVCFDSSADICPEENKYRILGIYDNSVKLMKAIPVDKDNDGILELAYRADDTFQWSLSNSNDYSNSYVRSYLNNDFYNTINSEYQSMIRNSTWHVGGNNSAHTTAYNFYVNSILIPVSEITVEDKIGLMYISDYGYAAYQNAWSTNLYYYSNQDIKENNWVHNLNEPYAEWTIVPFSSGSYAWIVDSNGMIQNYSPTYYYGVRPTFYLQENIIIEKGDGSESNPFKLSL